MGNCLRSSHHHPSHSSTTRPTTSGGTSSSCSRNTQSSATRSSSAAIKGPFSQTVSEIEEEDDLEGAGAEILEVPNLKVFTFAELRSATKNFRPESLLGEGGFGKVYRGWLDPNTLLPSKSGFRMPVAIKKLSQGGMQGFEEWQSEVNFLGRVSHPNLVMLLGYCWEDKELLLVYEFMAKGSLEIHLFRRNLGIEPICWDLRIKIAIEAAQGLAFLHTSEMVIYRDFKSSNILLDEMYNAKISDFGLVKLGPSGGASHVTTRVKGSYVYAAPEYVATGHLYVKSDVYGFGVVLLELMTGLMALDIRRPNGHQNLVEWLKPSLSKKKKIKTIMDVRIGSQYSSKGAIQLADLTLKCLELDPKSRPSMREVLVALRRIRMLKVEKSKDEPKRGRSYNGGTCRQVPQLQYL